MRQHHIQKSEVGSLLNEIFKLKYIKNCPIFGEFFFLQYCITSIHNSNFLTNLNFPPKQKSWFFKKLLVILFITSRLQANYLF